MNAFLLYCALAPALVSADPPVSPTAEVQSVAGNAAEVVITDIPDDLSLPPVLDVRSPFPTESPLPAARAPEEASVHRPSNATEPKPDPRGDVVVVCPPTLLSAMAPWIEYRQSQGYRVVQIDGMLSSAEIARSIRKFAREASRDGKRNRLQAVVLVGDTEPKLKNNAIARRRSVPNFVVAGPINGKLSGDAKIASDNPYGDLDGDQIADVPVGRLSVDTAEQLSQLVTRIIQYEQLPRSGNWRRTVHLTAGVGDFGPIADTVIETTARKFLTDGFPAPYRTTMTYGNWRSPYCPDPRVFRETVLRRVDEGCLFWVYMGHGQPYRLDRFEVAKALVPILETNDVPRFRASQGMPIAIMLACYAGAYDLPQDCVAERMLRNPEGPVGVLAASRVTLPYSMTLLGTSLMDGYFAGRASRNSPMTLGEVFLYGKRGLASEEAGGKNRKLIDTLARTLSPTKENLPLERLEHQHLFNLFGDPLLEIDRPQSLPIACANQVKPGQRLRAQVAFPIAGRCEVELVCRRDRLTFSPPRRKSMESHPEQFTQMNATYARANDPRWFHQTLEVRPGRFYIDVPIPEAARGPSHLRMMVQGSDRMAIGAADVYIQQPTASASKDLRTSSTKR